MRLSVGIEDAEDLLQDTLLKSFASLSTLSHREQPLQAKSFLFRVATNHWIDQCRKMKVKLNEFEDEHHYGIEVVDRLEVNEAIEMLFQQLTPKQVIVFILMESFNFTSKETAELIAATETAVNAILYRARANIIKLKATQESEISTRNQTTVNTLHPETVKVFIDIYNRKDFRGLANLLIDEATFSFVSMNISEYGKDTIIKKSLNPDTGTKLVKDLFVYADNLWGQPAIIILLNTEQGQMLCNINTLEWEENKIARWKDYSFCRDFMQAAAHELGLKLSDFI